MDMSFLSNPAWQGIAGIFAIISVILFMYAERDKIFSGPTAPYNLGRLAYSASRFAVGLVLVTIICAGGYLISTYIAIFVIQAVGVDWGPNIAGAVIGIGVAIIWATTHYFLLHNQTKNMFGLYAMSTVVFVSIGFLAPSAQLGIGMAGMSSNDFAVLMAFDVVKTTGIVFITALGLTIAQVISQPHNL